MEGAPRLTQASTCSKRLWCKRKKAGIETTRSTAVSVVALLCAYLVVGRLALELLTCLGFLRLSNQIMLTLAALASVGFVVASLMLLSWQPTAALGQILVDRVLNSRSNWETDTLRSFCEVGIWLSVIGSTYEATEGGISGSISALLCGTTAGVLLVLVGEALKAPLRNVEKFLRESSDDEGSADESTLSLDSGSMMLLALFGFSAISTIYENVADVFVACGLASLGGLAILTVAKMIQMIAPTRCIGMTLQSRLLNTFENWRSYPMRSALESSFFAAVVFGMYTSQGNAMFALQVGALSGIAIVLTSELFEHGVLFGEYQKPAQGKEQPPPPLPACIVAYGSFALLVLIYALKERQLLEAALSTIANCLGWVVVAHVCLRCTATAHVGTVINDRIIHAASNWAELPARSTLETSLFVVAQLVAFSATKSVFASALAGTATGLVCVLLCEALGWGHLPWQAKPVDTKTEQRPPVLAPGEKAEDKLFTWAQIAEHSSPGDIWLAIDGRVYDVSDWAPSHPGGSIIFKFAGVDASDQFAAFHQPRVAKRLPRFLIGRVAPDEDGSNPSPFVPSGPTLDYRALRERLWKEGYFKPSSSYYLVKGGVCAGLGLVAVAVLLSDPKSTLRNLTAAVLLGVSLQQTAFLTHDAAHNGVVMPASGGGFNWLAWIMGSCIFGISPGMWNEEHSMHHAITLRPCEDPQFNYLPLWLISTKELDVPGVKVDMLTRALVSIQHYSFLPVAIIIGRFNFHLIAIVWAVKYLLTAQTPRQAFTGLMDILGMVIYAVWFSLLVAQVDGGWARALFVLTCYMTVGVLHVQLIISHMATETFTAEEEREEQFFSFQMKTTRNIDSYWYDHWFHGGLEYQIEHHLFPQLPRHNLSKVQPFVQEICQRHGIPYMSTSFSGALMEVLCDLQRLSTELVHLKMG